MSDPHRFWDIADALNFVGLAIVLYAFVQVWGCR